MEKISDEKLKKIEFRKMQLKLLAEDYAKLHCLHCNQLGLEIYFNEYMSPVCSHCGEINYLFESKVITE